MNERDTDPSNGPSVDDEWNGRIHYLEKTIQKMTEDHHAMTSDHFEKVETSIRQEVAALESSFLALREEVMAKPTNLSQEDVPIMLAGAIEALQKVQVTLR
jgi:hypothetical protein